MNAEEKVINLLTEKKIQSKKYEVYRIYNTYKNMKDRRDFRLLRENELPDVNLLSIVADVSMLGAISRAKNLLISQLYSPDEFGEQLKNRGVQYKIDFEVCRNDCTFGLVAMNAYNLTTGANTVLEAIVVLKEDN